MIKELETKKERTIEHNRAWIKKNLLIKNWASC